MTTNLQLIANKVFEAIAGKDAIECRHSKYNLSRTDYRKMKRTAIKEYRNAKDQGFSDTEILDSLYSGTGSQMMYAKFLEHEIVGKDL